MFEKLLWESGDNIRKNGRQLDKYILNNYIFVKSSQKYLHTYITLPNCDPCPTQSKKEIVQQIKLLKNHTISDKNGFQGEILKYTDNSMIIKESII